MTRFSSTINPPAAISYFTPASGDLITAMTVRSSTSLMEERIRSAFESAQRELDRYRAYQPLWDGYRAQPFSREVLQSANEILEYSGWLFLSTGVTPALVTTGPASDGSIDVELQVAERHVLITLYPEEKQVRVSSFDAQEAHEDTEPVGEETVERWFNWLRQPTPVPGGVDPNQGNP